MRALLRVSAAVAAVALTAGSAAAQAQIQPAQPPQPGGPPIGIGVPGFSPQLMLLGNKAVQEELKLSEEQTKKVAELAAKQQGMFKPGEPITPDVIKKFQEMGQAAQKAVADLLKPEQLKRLQQLEVQQRGPMAFFDPRVTKELGITPEQQAKLGMAIAESFKKRAEMFKDIKDFKEIQKRMAEMNQAALEDIVKGLTPEQQTKWKELAGEPFKGTLPGGIGGFGPFPPPPPPVPPDIRPVPVPPPTPPPPIKD